jgi:hypothetical protein
MILNTRVNLVCFGLYLIKRTVQFYVVFKQSTDCKKNSDTGLPTLHFQCSRSGTEFDTNSSDVSNLSTLKNLIAEASCVEKTTTTK